MERINYFGRTDAQSPLKNELFFDQELNELKLLPLTSTFDDIDDDGDLDAFIGGKTDVDNDTSYYNIKNFRNTESDVNPQFTEVAEQKKLDY